MLSALSRNSSFSTRQTTVAILLIFQAMDEAGKDGAIRHVMSGVKRQGCRIFSFKHPSATELHHDFLWRTTRDLLERGRYLQPILLRGSTDRPCAWDILLSEGLSEPPRRQDFLARSLASVVAETCNRICLTSVAQWR